LFRKRSKRISAVGTFTQNLMTIDDETIEWIEAKEFNLADLAKIVGVDSDHNIRLKISLEVVTEPCETCGKPTTGDKVCNRCGRIICDECAKTNLGDRYCPVCHDLNKLPQTSLVQYSSNPRTT
jgi:formylmethanofuran dehydrogenase subunit E